MRAVRKVQERMALKEGRDAVGFGIGIKKDFMEKVIFEMGLE